MNEFLKNCLKLKSHDVIRILEDHRTIKDSPVQLKDESILISIKIPQSLLTEFRAACAGQNVKYQTQMKNLMREWLKES